jgi:hypothetical protein
MNFYKLPVIPDADHIAYEFNAQFKPDIIPENDDPSRMNGIEETANHQGFLVGEKESILFYTFTSDITS